MIGTLYVDSMSDRYVAVVLMVVAPFTIVGLMMLVQHICYRRSQRRHRR